MVAQAQPRGLPGVVEGVGEVVAALAEVGPAVVVRRDDNVGPEHRGGRGGRRLGEFPDRAGDT